MSVLYDAPGRHVHVTVAEADRVRYLLLDGCEQGGMSLDSDEPPFDYLGYHRVSRLVTAPVRRILVLGAGAFTAAKGLALDHPRARVDVVDVEPDLGPVGRQFFNLDRPEYSRIRFHGVPAEEFLLRRRPVYDFLFDDLFEGYQRVPAACRGVEHFRRLRGVLRGHGLGVKNVIWSRQSAQSRAACDEARAALAAVFPHHATYPLGNLDEGYNLLLVGSPSPFPRDDLPERIRIPS